MCTWKNRIRVNDKINEKKNKSYIISITIESQQMNNNDS